MAERILVTLEDSTTVTHCHECRFQDEFHNSYCDVFHASREYDIHELQFKRLAGCMRARNESEKLIAEGRSIGRVDVAKYSNAIGRIEAVLGIVGAKPLSETVAAVEGLKEAHHRMQRHFDEASPEHSLLELLDLYEDRAKNAVQEWKGANGYDDLLAAYSSAVDAVRDREAETLKSEAELDEACALLRRIVRYHDEDRAVTPGCTRLARVVAEAKRWLPDDEDAPVATKGGE